MFTAKMPSLKDQGHRGIGKRKKDKEVLCLSEWFFLLFNYSCPILPSVFSPALPTPQPTFNAPHPPPLSLSLGPLDMFLDLC